MFTRHGITAFRMSKDGQIAWIKHATYGWMDPSKFLLIQQIKDAPWDKIIEGGYRINSSIYNLPAAGPTILISATAAIVYSLAIEDYKTAAILVAAMILPFGAIYLAYLFLTEAHKLLVGVLEGAQELLGDAIQPLFGPARAEGAGAGARAGAAAGLTA